MKIPKVIQNEAKRLGWRGVCFVGENYWSAFFAEPPVLDASGAVLPTGIPELLVWDGSEVLRFTGTEALRLLGLLDHS